MKGLEEFTNLYSLKKTLRFKLKPIGETEEHIKNKGFIQKDKQLAEEFKKAKKIIDEYHKIHIEEGLSSFSFQEEELKDFSEKHKNFQNKRNDDQLRKKFKELQGKLREKLAEKLKHKEAKEIIDKHLERPRITTVENIENPREVLEKFKRQTTYFKGFDENRKNIYTKKPHSTSIGFRLIHQNLPKFFNNMEHYRGARDLGINFSELKKETGEDLDGFFLIGNFNKCLKQQGIDKYNEVIGKINKVINLHAQGVGNNEKKRRIRGHQLEKLYKQILSDREETAFLFEEIIDDASLCQKVSSLFQIPGAERRRTDKNSQTAPTSLDDFEKKLKESLDDLRNAEHDKIYIKNGQPIRDISKQIYESWDKIKDCLKYYAEQEVHPTPRNGRESQGLLKKRKKWCEKPYFSFTDIQNSINSYSHPNSACENPLLNYFKNLSINRQGTDMNLFAKIRETIEKVAPVLTESQDSQVSEIKKDDKIEIIKNYLDSCKELQLFLMPLNIRLKNDDDNVDALKKDGGFYKEFEELYKEIEAIIPVYNQARNYLTKKPHSTEKFKLNFENQTLADGWDKNKETANTCIILMRKKKYFLGVINTNDRKIFKGNIPDDGECYEKMEYKYLPGCKSLYHTIFSAEHANTYNPPEIIKEIIKNKSHKENRSDMCKMVDFLKESIDKNPDWQQFNFEFSPTEDYSNITDFYREVENQGYKITFKDVSKNYIDTCVNKGKLYLFEIYSKDFSSKSTGTPNLNTLYWKALFGEKYLKDVVYKLDGKAELFYREKSLEYPKNIWQKGHHSNDPRKKQKYPIIKDKRYAENTYLFHVPTTCNFKSKRIKDKDINPKVNKFIKSNPNINIIGIDRGERHLAYYTLINQKGEILEQESLNAPTGKNYCELLDKREKERDAARKSWKMIQKIKDLKEGYLSQVVHKIANLMVDKNAIIVLEDLNFGFKNSRLKIEKQVYQNLEKKLIEKLNFLVFKKKKDNETGGLLKALQLTGKFESFKKLGKQTGFIFYVPAYYTSAICPVTGFVNLLKPKYENITKARAFFGKFKKICFNKNENNFEFHFNYNDFTNKAEGCRQDWIVYGREKRLENFRNQENGNQWETREVDVVKEIYNLFKENAIQFKDGQCLKEKICQKDNSNFFKSLIHLLKLILKIRNSRIGTEEDKLISPVKDHAGKFFNSDLLTEEDNSLPRDADANGAYHIALKGLLLLEQLSNVEDVEKFKPDLSNKAWYKFAQSRHPA